MSQIKTKLGQFCYEATDFILRAQPFDGFSWFYFFVGLIDFPKFDMAVQCYYKPIL